MNVWACPNVKCFYDKELHSGQKCPLCGEEAKEFSFSDVDGLLKKWKSKKSVKKAQREERLSSMRKFCPKCGSANISFPVFLSSFGLEVLELRLRRSLHHRRWRTCRRYAKAI